MEPEKQSRPTPDPEVNKPKKSNWLVLSGLLLCLLIAIAYVGVRTDTFPRFQTWLSIQQLNGPRDKLAAGLSGVGTVLAKGTHIGCGITYFGYTCSGDAYVYLGTNQNLSQIKRPVIDALHSLGYMADDTPQAEFVNFAKYPDASIAGNVGWDNSVQSNTTYSHLPNGNKYKYYIVASIGLSNTEAKSEDAIDFKGNADPLTIPKVNYPANSVEGTFTYFNHLTNKVSYTEFSTSPSKYVSSTLCDGFNILDQNNSPVSQSSLPQGMDVAFYFRGNCVSIISVNMQNISAAAGDNIRIDKPAQLYQMGTESCSNAGPPLEDEQAFRVTLTATALNYSLGFLVSRSLCPGFAIYDQNGNKISAAQLTSYDYVSVYHYGNVAVKAQVTVPRTSANSPTK